MSSESHGHIQPTGDTEDLLVSGGTKTDIPCCVVINGLDGAAGDRGADRIAEGVLGASAGAGDRIAAECALAGAAGAGARGSNAHRGELQILGFGHQLHHFGAEIRGGCVGEAAVLHRRAGGGAEVVDGNGKPDGDRHAGLRLFLVAGSQRIDGQAQGAGDGRGIGAIGGRELEAGEVGARDLADRGCDGIAVAAGRIVEIEGQRSGDHHVGGLVHSDGQADGPGRGLRVRSAGLGGVAEGLGAEVGIAYLAGHLVDGGRAGDGELTGVFLALCCSSRTRRWLSGTTTAVAEGAAPVLQFGAVRCRSADAIGPSSGINDSVAGIDAVFGGICQLLDVDAASSRQSKGSDLAIPIRQAIACLPAEIVIRKIHFAAAFPCGAHESAGRGYGRDAAIVGGI